MSNSLPDPPIKPTSPDGRRYGPWGVLILMLILTLIVSYSVGVNKRDEEKDLIRTAVRDTQRDIKDRMNVYVSALYSVNGLFTVVPIVNARQFHEFVEKLEIKKRYPGIQGIGYTRRVPPEKRERFTALMRRLDPAFKMWPEGDRPETHAIMYLEPMDDRNRRALGFDMFSDPTRRAAMSEARDTGLPAATGKVRLMQETDSDPQSGFLIYVPVYDQSLPLRTVEDRRRALEGFVYSPFRMDDLMNGILGSPTQHPVDFEVYDGERISPENLMYRSEAGKFSSSPASSRTETLQFAGHTWTLLFYPPATSTGGFPNGFNWPSLLMGLILSAAVFYILHRETRARAEGERITDEIRRSEEAVRRSQEELRLVTDALPVLISYVGADCRYGYTNRAYEDWFGIPRDQLPGCEMEEVVGEEAYELLLPHVRAVLSGREEYFEERIPYKRAGVRYINATYIPQFDDGRRVEGFVALIQDVSDRKRLEGDLRESEARFRTMADTAPVLLWVSGTDTLFNYVNKPWLDFRGRSLEEEVGTGWVEALHPDDVKGWTETYILAFNAREKFQSEFRLRRADGEYRWLLCRGVPRLTPDGSFSGYIGSCLDITERKRSEGEEKFLAQASTLLASSLDYKTTLNRVAHLAVPDLADWCAVDMFEADGTVQRLAVAHVDPSREEYAWELWRRYPPRTGENDGLMRVLRTGESEVYPEITDEMLQAGTRDDEHLRIARELGLKSALVVPLIARGRTLGVITFVSAESGRRYSRDDLGLLEDLAHRAAIAVDNARLFGETQEADRRKDEFLATLAHELRNPLAPMLNAVHLIRTQGSSDPILQRTKEILERQVMHMARLVDDLLDVSRITRDQIELRKEAVRLDTLFEHAVQTSRPLIDEREQELSVRLPAEPITLHADPTRLNQVIANLLNNSAKYTPPGGKIELSAEREGEVAVLRVSDTGRGISREMLPRIFDLFAQEAPTLDRTQGGLGLGLTLVRKLVERHGGTITAHSEGTGRGSEFVVRLPIYTPGAEAPRDPVPAEAPPADSPSRRILVVDDNRDAAQMLAEVLFMWGHEVRTAFDGQAAIEMARSFVPEVVLLDIGLPVMDGYEVARQIRLETALDGARLIALTGYGQASDRSRSAEAGFDRHITKPVDLDVLKTLIVGEGTEEG